MDRQARRAGGSRYSLLATAFLVIALTCGLILWADIPAPKPDLKVKVQSFTPTGATNQKTNISIRFSNDLVGQDSLNRPAFQVPVTFEPEIPGLARWTNTDLLVICPDEPLLPATRYTATVHSGRDYVNGNAIAQDQQFQFHTAPFVVKVIRYSAQRVRNLQQQARLVIDLEFTYPVSREGVREKVSIRGKQNATAAKLSIAKPDTSLQLESEPELAKEHRIVTEPFEIRGEEQQYQLVIPGGFRCEQCGEGLADAFEYIMEVPQRPRMELWVESVRARTPGKQGVIEIGFSAQVPTEEIKNYISVDPPVEFSISGFRQGVILRGNFRPRTVYTVNIAAGMMSADGTLMEREFSGKVETGDLPPSIRFTTPGIYLPREGGRLLEVETINIDTLSIEIEQIFANNLVTYMASGSDRSYRWSPGGDLYGRKLFVKDFPLAEQHNEELVSTIDIGGIIGDTLRGVFAVAARNKSQRWTVDTRHVMMTDIGILARMSGRHLMVWVNNLSQAKPINKAYVKLFSRNNQLLLEGRTNPKGVVIFNDIAGQIEGFQPYLITVEKDDELAYLRFDDTRLPLSEFDVSGRPYLERGYEAYLYFDRGVYRPGETAHLVSLVRGRDGVLPESFPYLIKTVDPRGKLFREFRMDAGRVMNELDIDLPADLPTGRYNLSAYLADEYELGSGSFLVEEFVPDRIKVTIETDQERYLVGEKLSITVRGRMLYGPPAAGHKATLELSLQPQEFRPSAYSKYRFGDPSHEFAVQRITLGDSILSDSGTALYRYALEPGIKPPSQLNAQVWATVSEMGGRAVSSFKEVTLHPYERYLGVKTNLDGYARPGEPVRAHIIAIDPDAEPAAVDSVEVRFSRLVYSSMMRHEPDGSYRFVSEETKEVIDSVWISLDSAGLDLSFTPPDYGRYEIVARDIAGGHVSAVRFYASGWGRVPWSMEQPDRLDLDLDRESYLPGSRARLQVRAPFPGRLLLTIENETVQDYFTVELPENTAEIDIPIERSFAPNVYVTGTLIRPAKEIARHTPARAFGVVPLIVTPQERRLSVDIEASTAARPYDTLTLKLTTDGTENTHVTVAAEDAGILQLTDFETPDPFQFFYGKRRPALDAYDLYSQVYPEIEPAASHLSPAGGVSKARSKRHLNPFAARRVKVVSLWSGVITTDSNGTAPVKFALPEFNGQLIVTAVAADGDRFGAQTTSLLVRDKIVIQESFPRFVAPDDAVDGMVTIFNGMDTATTIAVTLGLSGNVELLSAQVQSLRLAGSSEGTITFRFKAGQVPGIINVRIDAEGGGEHSLSRFELSNRPAQPLKVEYGSGVVTGDSAAVFTLPGNWVPGTDEYLVKTSSLAAVRVTRNIEYLLRYPYGCVEQTTSALFPLLYFDDLAKVVRPELFGGKGHEYFLAKGIEKLLRYQRSDGSFVYWPGGDRINNWSAVYAADFLIEARLAGYDVESAAYEHVLDFLTNMARGKKYSDIETEHRVYACHVLAKAGKLNRKLADYLTSLNVDELPAYSRYQLAAALALSGDIEYARELVPFDVQPELGEPEDGGNFSSGVRTNAILLNLLLEVDPENASTFALAKSLLDDSRLNRWDNTQSTAFALMSLGKFFRTVGHSAFTGELRIEGLDSYRIDTSDFTLVREDLGGRTITIEIDSAGPCFYFWQASGIPLSPVVEEFERGIRIRREYLNAGGEPIDPGAVSLGSQVIGHVTIEAIDKRLRNVVVSDLLPAGFEIENPRLATTPNMPWLPKEGATPEYQDIRDDRLLLFTHLSPGGPMNFYYGLRAIAAGEFTIPPVAAECMYNPLIAGSSSAGGLVVRKE
jgi:uncharacterized protein YfaS (alpha-2-macroglobulin family)